MGYRCRTEPPLNVAFRFRSSGMDGPLKKTARPERDDDETPFWRRMALAEMSQAQWESLCDGCARCCLNKLEDWDTGAIHWTELNSGDLKADLAWLSAALGITAEAFPMPSGEYFILKGDGGQLGGAMQSPMPGSFWLSWVQVDDVDATLARRERVIDGVVGVPATVDEEAEVEIGVVLALLNAATFAGGFIHNWISKAYSLTHARWALILSETAALLLAAILLSLDFAFVPVAIGIVLATKGICGGPPTFEAMLYDLGPTDPAASGLQRSLGMMAAIASATAALALAEWLELDILATIIGTLALAYALQLAAFAWLSRALPLTS